MMSEVGKDFIDIGELACVIGLWPINVMYSMSDHLYVSIYLYSCTIGRAFVISVDNTCLVLCWGLTSIPNHTRKPLLIYFGPQDASNNQHGVLEQKAMSKVPPKRLQIN